MGFHVASALVMAVLSSPVATPAATPAAASPRATEARPIRLRAAVLDVDDGVARHGSTWRPAVESEATSADLVAAPFATSTHDLFLVRFAGRIGSGHREVVRASGAEALGGVPHDTLLVRADAASRDRLRAAAGVSWVGHLQPAWRLEPALLLPFAGVDLEVVLARGSDPSAALAAWTAAGLSPRATGTHPGAGERIRLIDASRGHLPVVAGRSEVAWVERSRRFELAHSVVRSSADVPLARGGAAGPFLDVDALHARGLTGRGQVVAFADTGLDVGRITAGDGMPALHADFGEAGSATNPLRLLAALAPGDMVPGMTLDWSDVVPHGTQVAGSLAGGGVLSGARPEVSDYAGSEAGMAPEALLVAQKILDYETDDFVLREGDWADRVFGRAHDLGARVHSNSWGVGRGSAFVAGPADAAAFDHDDMLIVFAGGNGGRDGPVGGWSEGWDVGCDPGWTLQGGLPAGCPSAADPPSLPTWTSHASACDAPYPPDLDTCLISPWWDVVPAAPPATLTLVHRVDAPDGIDNARIDLDRNGDGVFDTPLATWTGPAPAGLVEETLALPATGWGSRARLRLRFTSDGSTAGDGWALTTLRMPDGVIDLRTLDSEAKNALVVGGSESWRPEAAGDLDDPTDCSRPAEWDGLPPIDGDHAADAPEGMTPFSGRGPATDGRLSPQVVAPAWSVLSTRSRASPPDDARTCALPPDLAASYEWFGGTSGAAPLVAGIAVLARQAFVDGWHPRGTTAFLEPPDERAGFEPSSALLRALLAGGAHPIAPGQYPPPLVEMPDRTPNVVSGHGRVDARGAIVPHEGADFSPARRTLVIDRADGLRTGEVREHAFDVEPSSEDLRVTLAWTDPPATLGAGRQLVNDLDLVVVLPDGTERRAPAADGRTPNRLDNLEHVQLPAGGVDAGRFVARVEAIDVPGSPLRPASWLQSYALVISGGLAPCEWPGELGPSLRLTKAPASSSVRLSWSPPASERPPSGYSAWELVDARPFSPISEARVDVTEWEAPVLHDGRNHFYRVSWRTACGTESPLSPP